jgi:polar amino acid transport system substrate-binding protein
VTPPAVATAGVLRAGIDFDYPPYGGTDEGERAGLDLDIAAALADKLGLKLEVVDVPPSEGQQALDSDSIDVIMSATLGDSPAGGVSVAGTYLSTAPGLFGRVDADASAEPSLTVDTIGDRTVVVQKESETYWLLDGVYGQEYASPVDTLRDGFEAVAAERASLVAGDTIVGAYMARDFGGIGFVGQLAPATPIGVGVAQDNPELNDAVRQALDELATDGVLDAVRTKWVGDLPELRIAEESDG